MRLLKIKESPNNSLHLPAIPLRSMAAGELGRYMYSGPQNETVC